MKKYRNMTAVLLIFLFAIGGWVCNVVAQETTYSGPPITLRFSAHGPSSHYMYKVRYQFFDIVKNESKGKLLFKVS